MNIETICNQTGVCKDELVSIVDELNETHQLDIGCEFTPVQYNVVRSLVDRDYMISKLLSLTTNAALKESDIFDKWVMSVDPSGLSSKEISNTAPGGTYNMQQVSRLMRANGYESKVIYLGNDKQGRRWFKAGDVNAVNAKARREHKQEVSFL